MRFRRRSNVTDIEVARRAASGLGAYDTSRETADVAYLESADRTIGDAYRPVFEARLYDDKGPVPTESELADSSVSARPALSIVGNPDVESAGHSHFPGPVCPKCSGHVAWIERGNHFDGICYGECGDRWSRFKPQEGDDLRAQTRTETWRRRIEESLGPAPASITKACEWIDELERDNRRLKSELNQAIAQLRIARQKCATAEAERDTARAAASSGRMAP